MFFRSFRLCILSFGSNYSFTLWGIERVRLGPLTTGRVSGEERFYKAKYFLGVTRTIMHTCMHLTGLGQVNEQKVRFVVAFFGCIRRGLGSKLSSTPEPTARGISSIIT